MSAHRLALRVSALVVVSCLALSSCYFIVNEDKTNCGNGMVEGLEECDRSNFGRETCESRGYSDGYLMCTPFCRILEYNCYFELCGNGECDWDEDYNTCPDDCKDTPECGDGKCNQGEDESNCPQDCLGSYCGDGFCNRISELDMCSEDCDSNLWCGDGLCHQFERDHGGCPEDCSDCNHNGVCDPITESTSSCPDDCYCGNGTCDPGEDHLSCPTDCPATDECGDDNIDYGEQCDGANLGSATCQTVVGIGGGTFSGGSLGCTPECQFYTWDCTPSELGARCSASDECQQRHADAICEQGTTGVGMCTISCANESTSCPEDLGTECVHVTDGVFSAAGLFCLRPCTGGERDCSMGLTCREVPGGSAETYCLPPAE